MKIVTLAIAFSTSILIILFARNEFGFDRFHRDYSDVVRVLQKNMDVVFSGNRLSNNIPADVFAFLKVNSIDSNCLSRVKVMNEIIVDAGGEIYQNQRIHAADPSITGIFTFDILNGSVTDFNEREVSILLSSSSALKYFSTTYATGKQMKAYTGNDTLLLRVAAVFKDFPENSHDAFECFIRYDSSSIHALRFSQGASGVYGKVPGVEKTRLAKAMNGNFMKQNFTYQFQPIADIYFGPRVIGEASIHGDLYSVIILLFITALIFFLAVSNFLNLTTLTLPQRAKELAIKKLAGTSQLELVFAFLRESFSIVAVSFILGMLVLVLTTRWVEPILGININSLLITGNVVSIFIAGFMFVILGSAPLLVTFKFISASPVRLLSSESITFPLFKRIITFFQLGISIFLIVASTVIGRQIDYSLVKEPGRNHDQVVYLRYPHDLTREGLYGLRESWQKNNGNILDVMATSQLPDRVTSKEVGSNYYIMSVDPEFMQFFDLKMIQGNWFKPNDGDSIVVMNQSGYNFAGGKISNVIGVFEDINGRFNNPERPLKVNLVPQYRYNFLCVRILEVDVRRTIRFLSEYFKQGSYLPQVYFFDKSFEAWVVYQDRLNSLTKFLSIVTIILSCLSIYGLSVSIVRDKLKPIAIHKLCGADTLHISRILIREFTTQLMLAIVIFGPLTYVMLKEVLRKFVYATPFILLDPFVPLAYCTFIITILCTFQALTLNRGALSSALKG